MGAVEDMEMTLDAVIKKLQKLRRLKGMTGKEPVMFEAQGGEVEIVEIIAPKRMIQDTNKFIVLCSTGVVLD